MRETAIEVWSDVACPWCLLGNAHLAKALEKTGIPASIEMKSFQLAPDLQESMPVAEYLIKRFGSAERVADSHHRLITMGAEVGLKYQFDTAIVANTFDAHRLHHMAKAHGAGGPIMDLLLLAQHTEGKNIGDRKTLLDIAIKAGLEVDEVANMLDGDAYSEEVRSDIAEAHQLGVQGVPFFVFDRKFALSGAQPIDVFERALLSTQSDDPPATA